MIYSDDSPLIPEYAIDASIVINWFSSESEKSIDNSLKLLQAVKTGEIVIYSTEFLLIEVLNVIYKKKHFSIRKVEKINNELLNVGIKFIPFSINEVSDIQKIMIKYKISCYDAIYLEAAERNKCKLITMDKELLKIKNLTIGLDQLEF